MTYTMRVRILALALALLLPFNAVAADKKPAPKPARTDAWDIVAIRKTDGAFGFCRAERRDKESGLTLAIALSPTKEINIGIKVPDGEFKKGETFPLTLRVDGTNWTKPSQAEAALPDLLLIRLGTDETLLTAVTQGTAFVAKGDVDESRFTLAGSAQMMDALRSCIADGSKGALPPLPKGDLPEGLAALLKEAKLDVKPIKLAGGKEANAVDYAWTVALDGATLDGGFREARVKPTDDFKKLAAGTIDNLKAQCKQGLKSAPGPEEKFSQLTMQTYNLSCGDEFVGLVTYRTATDIYGILMHRGKQSEQKQAISARDRIAAILRKIGATASAK